MYTFHQKILHAVQMLSCQVYYCAMCLAAWLQGGIVQEIINQMTVSQSVLRLAFPLNGTSPGSNWKGMSPCPFVLEQIGFLVLVSLCPRIRAGAKIPGQTLLVQTSNLNYRSSLLELHTCTRILLINCQQLVLLVILICWQLIQKKLCRRYCFLTLRQLITGYEWRLDNSPLI